MTFVRLSEFGAAAIFAIALPAAALHAHEYYVPEKLVVELEGEECVATLGFGASIHRLPLFHGVTDVSSQWNFFQGPYLIGQTTSKETIGAFRSREPDWETTISTRLIPGLPSRSCIVEVHMFLHKIDATVPSQFFEGRSQDCSLLPETGYGCYLAPQKLSPNSPGIVRYFFFEHRVIFD